MSILWNVYVPGVVSVAFDEQYHMQKLNKKTKIRTLGQGYVGIATNEREHEICWNLKTLCLNGSREKTGCLLWNIMHISNGRIYLPKNCFDHQKHAGTCRIYIFS